eukprot:4460622-Alexandrium_andersonii.AAC.1
MASAALGLHCLIAGLTMDLPGELTTADKCAASHGFMPVSMARALAKCDLSVSIPLGLIVLGGLLRSSCGATAGSFRAVGVRPHGLAPCLLDERGVKHIRYKTCARPESITDGPPSS